MVKGRMCSAKDNRFWKRLVRHVGARRTGQLDALLNICMCHKDFLTALQNTTVAKVIDKYRNSAVQHLYNKEKSSHRERNIHLVHFSIGGQNELPVVSMPLAAIPAQNFITISIFNSVWVSKNKVKRRTMLLHVH